MEKIEKREIRLLYSKGIEKELFFVLKQMKARREFLGRVKNILALSRKVRPAEKIEVVKDDYSDNKYFACALSGKADWIVSSDKHFHSVKNFAIPVVKASEFMTSYNV